MSNEAHEEHFTSKTLGELKSAALAKQTEAYTHPKGSDERAACMEEAKHMFAHAEAGCCANN